MNWNKVGVKGDFFTLQFSELFELNKCRNTGNLGTYDWTFYRLLLPIQPCFKSKEDKFLNCWIWEESI